MDNIRHEKAQKLRAQGGNPYASTFPRTHRLAQARAAADGTRLAIAGRVVLLRDMGKMTFAPLQDETGRMQIALRENEMAEGRYNIALELLDLGDIIGVEGERFMTKTGEPTVLVRDWTMLTKAQTPTPEKWHGIADQETAWRQRYLDLMSNHETMERFQKRSLFLRLLREFYWSRDFTEVETPVLVNAASGALATPFSTHHEAYDLDVLLPKRRPGPQPPAGLHHGGALRRLLGLHAQHDLHGGAVLEHPQRTARHAAYPDPRS